MKRIIICAFIVLALIIIGAASFYYTGTVAEDSGEAIDEISSSFEAGDHDRTRSLTRRLSESWQEYAENDIFILDKDHVIEISASVARIKALAENDDPELTVECAAAKELIMRYYEKNRITLKNIF